MNAHTDPRDDAYDVIVVGTGLGGISTAALLAKNGRKVLAVERGDGPGGYAHAFKRGDYLFDAAIHVIPEGEFVEKLLTYLGVQDLVNLLAVDCLYGTVFPDLKLNVPMGREEFVETHVRLFPHEAEAFREFFGVFSRVFREAALLPMQLTMTEVGRAEQEFPTLFKYRGATVSEMMDDYLSDPRLKALVTSCWSYMGLPPSKLSFLHFCQLLNVIIDGSFYCRGSFQNLVDAFVGALEQNGGELVVRNQVTRILIEDGRVRGVRLANEREIRAPVVVSNADARHTFEELVGAEYLPSRFLGRMRRMRPSVSAFLVFAATKLDLAEAGAGHDNFLFRFWDHDETYREVLEGKPGGMSANVPTLVDPSLAPPGEHAVILRALAPYDIGRPWREERDHYTELLLDECEKAYPGFRANLTFLESGTPLVLERYTNNYHGACYGWEISPEQVGSQRLGHESPVSGLFAVGHWTQEGAGSFRTMTSGVNTAQIILAKDGQRDVIPSFKRSDLLHA